MPKIASDAYKGQGEADPVGRQQQEQGNPAPIKHEETRKYLDLWLRVIWVQVRPVALEA